VPHRSRVAINPITSLKVPATRQKSEEPGRVRLATAYEKLELQQCALLPVELARATNGYIDATAKKIVGGSVFLGGRAGQFQAAS